MYSIVVSVAICRVDIVVFVSACLLVSVYNSLHVCYIVHKNVPYWLNINFVRYDCHVISVTYV